LLLFVTYLNKLAVAAAVLAVSFSDRITLGSVLVAFVLGLLGALNIIAGGRRWKDEFEAMRVHMEREQERANTAEANQLKAELRVQQLAERPDMNAVLTTIGELAVKEDAAGALRVASVERTVRQEFQNHETRAQERHNEAINVLREIANSLKEAR